MAYKPRIVIGKVTGTDYPIDGHELYFSQWDYDNGESFHLYGWGEDADEAVMQTMYQCEIEDGLRTSDTLEAFAEKWKAEKWEPAAALCLPLDRVEVLEVVQNEERDDAGEKMQAHGVSITPRKATDRGGILCLPLEKNLRGDVKAKHPDWKLIQCPHCGRNCWKPSAVDEIVEKQGVQLLCTECALRSGTVTKSNMKEETT